MMVASVMRTSALTVAKFLMRQNPVRVMLTSARGALSHVSLFMYILVLYWEVCRQICFMKQCEKKSQVIAFIFSILQ